MSCKDLNTTAAAVYTSDIPGHLYSPLTLSLEWPEVGRLVFLVACSTIGTIMNGFFISTFFVEPVLRKTSNVFLACVGLCDFIMTGVVIPTCAVVLLSREWDLEPVCNVLQIIAEFATYSYNMFFMMTALESFCKYCCSDQCYKFFQSNKVGVLVVMIYVVCFVTAAAGIILKLDYNYCTRPNYGNYYFRATTAIVFQVIPCIITLFSLFVSSIQLRFTCYQDPFYKRTLPFGSHFCDAVIHIFCYLLFVGAWIPYLLVVIKHPESCDASYYHTAWIGITRSVVSSFLYACLSGDFRRAFVQLFEYCCCKKTLQTSHSNRPQRGMHSRTRKLDIRVHLLQKAVVHNYSSRYASSSRDIQEL